MTSTSKSYCSVPQCSSYWNPQISLHRFPLDENMRKLWQSVLRIGKPITKGMTVCSLHFTENDYFPITPQTKLKRLKKNAVPSAKLPQRSHEVICRKRKAPRERIDTESNSPIILNQDPVPAKISAASHYDPEPGCSTSHYDPEPGCSTSHYDPEPGCSTSQYDPESGCSLTTPQNIYKSYDKSTQTASCKEKSKYDLLPFINTDKKMVAFTGVNIDTFELICMCVLNTVSDNGIVVKNLQVEVLLVLMKLKLNLSFICISTLLDIQLNNCRKIFYRMAQVLSSALECAIYWATKEEIVENLPICFNKFKNTRVILDCTEIPVQKSKSLQYRIKTYSHYKKTHTIKTLIGITPSGLISYLSPCYGGRASDKRIFLNEKVLLKLDPNDAVMVDKGFLIEKECQEHLVKLIRPPFLKKKQQLSKQESVQTAEIARARVHVERAIQRIKVFKIMKEQIGTYLLPYCDDILKIICAIINISSPILSKNKF
uniref:Uncharacterized protein LOC114339301 n=1 Tax=Diabrotica virgifera virgifera TaxID=50390 RepID=A0A6P7GPN9_DIAVI